MPCCIAPMHKAASESVANLPINPETVGSKLCDPILVMAVIYAGSFPLK